MAARKGTKASPEKPGQAAVDETVGEPGVQSPVEGTVGDPEWKPVENILPGSEMRELPAADPLPEPEETPPALAGQEMAAPGKEAPEGRRYRIICRNKVTETIGGVKFVDGVGYTKDGFSASWFANKNGYEVSRVDPGE